MKAETPTQQYLENLQQENAALKKQLETKDSHIKILEEKIKMDKIARFAKRSEKQTDANQLGIFDECEEPLEAEAFDDSEVEITVPEHKRKKRGRKPLPSNLPRVDKIHDITEEEKQCACGCLRDHIGDETSEQLDVIPAQVQVIRHIKRKYACKQCEGSLVTAKFPMQPIPGSIATANTLAYVATAKFCDHLPLYRLESAFKRMGIETSRATLSHWMIRCGQLLEPLIKVLHSTILEYDIAFADETGLQVLKEPGKTPTSRSYMWLFMGGAPDKFGMIYHYSPNRSEKVPIDFFEDYSGYIQSDGYKGYANLAKNRPITSVGCWAHARRKFMDIVKATKKAGLAHQAVQTIGRLYNIETKAKSLTPEDRKSIREEKAKPILKTFRPWLTKHLASLPSGSSIAKAINYTLNQWEYLNNYIKDGRCEIDNNRTERSIKPFVIGRKNWLFCNSVPGANAACNIFSLIETAKYHKLDPYHYLRFVFDNIQKCQTLDQLEALMPYHLDPQLLRQS